MISQKPGGTKIYIIDAQMGVSGDMLLGAVIDLDQMPKQKFVKTLESIGNVWTKTKVNVKNDNYYSISGKKITFKFSDKPPKKGVPATKVIDYFDKASDEIGLNHHKKMAREILDTLLNAEAKIHKCSMDKLHLHETGSPDTLIDILGFIHFYEEKKLEKEKIYCTPISVGQGIWKSAHGFFSVPAPAALEILKDMQFRFGPIDGELATPTGISILKNIIYEYIDYIHDLPITPKIVGYGLGTRVFEDYINILRVIYS
jgi:uncharacterized protein (DUF111 family)